MVLGDTTTLRFPIIKNIHPSLINKAIINVQPMATASMPIFYIKTRFQKPYTISYKHYKIGNLVNMFKHFIPDKIKEVSLEKEEVKYYY